MRHEYVNANSLEFGGSGPARVESEIIVDDLGGASVADLEVRLELHHEGRLPLTLRLIGPDGAETVLAAQAEPRRGAYRCTLFRASAEAAIDTATSLPNGPYRGVYQAAGDLRQHLGRSATGAWRLAVDADREAAPGHLERWSIGLDTEGSAGKPFSIDVRFVGGLSPTQQSAFDAAAARWAEIIVGDLAPVQIDGEIIDDVLIDAEGRSIDGAGKVLGQAGPTHLRPGSMLPAKGIMSFDTADLEQLEADGSLTDVILHEMGHVLGFGTLWSNFELIEGAGTANPSFVGINAMREYASLTDRSSPERVPVANTGGAGTRDGHWREAVFGDELLTGFISGSRRPLSRLSIAAFEDLGYRVDLDAADDYTLPSAFALAEKGVLTLHEPPYLILRTRPVVLPAASIRLS